jgi:hypothetical protein
MPKATEKICRLRSTRAFVRVCFVHENHPKSSIGFSADANYVPSPIVGDESVQTLGGGEEDVRRLLLHTFTRECELVISQLQPTFEAAQFGVSFVLVLEAPTKISSTFFSGRISRALEEGANVAPGELSPLGVFEKPVPRPPEWSGTKPNPDA